jgi:hypothetical protein
VASADGSKFFPVFQNNREALDALQELVTAEKTRLIQLQKTPMREGIAASKEASRLLAEGKPKEAQEQLTLSQKLWPANIENAKLKEQVDLSLKAQAETAKKQSPPASLSASKP